MILAHGLGGRTDLPLPTWMVSYGGAAVVVISFAALAVLWPKPRLEHADIGVVVASLRNPVARAVFIAGRAIGLAGFVLVATAAIAGENNPSVNLAPTAVYVVLWIAIPFVCALVGDIWTLLNPFDTLAAAARRLARTAREGPDLGYWPAAGALLAFVWLELVYPERAEPRTLAVAIVAYTIVAVVAGAVYGRDWLARSEGFTAFFRLLAHAAPLGRDDEGRLRLRAPFAGLATVPPTPGLHAVVLVILGSTSFDGLTRTQFWVELSSRYTGNASTILGTIGLVWVIGIVTVIYTGAIRLTARITDTDPTDTALAFAPSLVPIAFAYTVAHYFSLLVLEGQATSALISDPLGLGWDLFGTADNTINYNLLSPTAIAWVQAGAIVIGHVAGVVIAHDRALARFDPANSVRAQYPLLAAMVVFTIGGLFLLLSA